MKNNIIYRGNPIWGFRFLSYESFADMAELADAPDLGSGVYDVQVQVLLSALRNGRMRWNSVFPAVFLCPLILKWYCFNNYLMNRDGLICPQLRFALMGTRQSTGAGVAKHTLWPSRLAICRGSRWYWNRYCVLSALMVVYGQGNRSRAAYPLIFSEGQTLQTKERRAMPMNVTYSDMLQLLIFIVALVGLCYEIFKGKK